MNRVLDQEGGMAERSEDVPVLPTRCDGSSTVWLSDGVVSPCTGCAACLPEAERPSAFAGLVDLGLRRSRA